MLEPSAPAATATCRARRCSFSVAAGASFPQVPAYKMAPGASHMHLLRVCLRVGFDLEMADLLVHHVNLVGASVCSILARSPAGCPLGQSILSAAGQPAARPLPSPPCRKGCSTGPTCPMPQVLDKLDRHTSAAVQSPGQAYEQEQVGAGGLPVGAPGELQHTAVPAQTCPERCWPAARMPLQAGPALGGQAPHRRCIPRNSGLSPLRLPLLQAKLAKEFKQRAGPC